MITIIYSTHKDKEYNDKFKNHLLKTVGVPNPQILEYENHNQYSLSNVLLIIYSLSTLLLLII